MSSNEVSECIVYARAPTPSLSEVKRSNEKETSITSLPIKISASLRTEFWEIGDPKQIFLDEWREQIAEFLGTLMFVFMGTSTAVASVHLLGLDAASVVAISLGFGFGLTTMVYAMTNISGGHLNPAVTIGVMVSMRMPILKGFMFIIWQLAGASLGSLFVMGAFPPEAARAVNYGVTFLSTNATVGLTGATYIVKPWQGVFLEFVLTYTLVFTVFATAQNPRDKKRMGKFAPLAIGLCALVGHLVGVPFTGPSMNPARSFGPALISGIWNDHWVYWAGPLSGGILAAISYKYLFITKDDLRLKEEP